MLPKVTICYQKLPFVAKSYNLLQKVTICCQPGQYVSRDNMLPNRTGTICRLFEQQNNVKQGDILSRRHIVLGQYMSWDNMSRDKMSPDQNAIVNCHMSRAQIAQNQYSQGTIIELKGISIPSRAQIRAQRPMKSMNSEKALLHMMASVE